MAHSGHDFGFVRHPTALRPRARALMLSAPHEALADRDPAPAARARVVRPEYLTVLDACVPPPREPELRRATLRAELGALVHEVELEWTAVPEDEPSDDPFEPHEACHRAQDGLGDRGCGCSSQGSRGAGWLALGVVLGAAARRRRARRSRDG